MNLETIILSERNQTYKTTCCMIPFIGNIQNKQVHKTESILVVARGQESGWGGNGDNLMAIGFLWGKFEISGISDENIILWMVVQLCEYTKKKLNYIL